MKKIRLILFLIIIVGLTIFNLSYISLDNNDSVSKLTLKGLVMNTAQAEEIDPVIIVCDTGGSGRCWDTDCTVEHTPFGPIRVTYCPTWTGHTTDICVEDMPC